MHHKRCISPFPDDKILEWSELKQIADDILTLYQTSNSSKLKELADDYFKFHINGRKFSKWVENTAGKGEIARYEQFLLFAGCFQKTCTADT